MNSCLEEIVCTDFDGDISKYVNQSLLATLNSIPEECHDVEERWIATLECEGSAVVATVSFLVWGCQRKWKNLNERDQWSELLDEMHMGKEIRDYYKSFRDYLFMLEVEKQSCREVKQPTAANTYERVRRDLKVPRKVDGLQGRRDHLSAVVSSFHIKARQLRKLLA